METAFRRLVGYFFPYFRKRRSNFRTVFVGNKLPSSESRTAARFVSNKITTSKYTVWNFVPKNLFEQFHRVANLYFLVIAIVQFTVDTPVPPWTSLFPLCVVVATTAVKQGYEDWVRHKADHEVNHCEANLVRDGKVEKVRSMDVHVGDVIKVVDGASLPCDVVLLASSSSEGKCHITSVNLDGETNLKVFYSVANTRHMQSDASFSSLFAAIECQQPTADLYKFVGRMRIYCDDGNLVSVPLGPDNVLLRGARVKNTPFVYGCAIYTGQETKISLNSRIISHKYSRVERKMNKFLLILLLLLIMYAVIWVGLAISFYSQPANVAGRLWYTEHLVHDFHVATGTGRASIVIQLFLGYMILCNNIIPVSMYVSIELQKFIGSKFFEWDLHIYNSETDEPAKAMTSDLNEELGQIQCLFTDKTGTLTQNEMMFRMCSCNGLIYHEVEGQLYHGFLPVETYSEELMALLLCLALCHTVHVDGTEATEQSDKITDDVHYQSASPDEKALVEACNRFGIVYCGCHVDRIKLHIKNSNHAAVNGNHSGMWFVANGNHGSRWFIRHHILEFDADRKCMSVIVEDSNDGSIWLICKGAETAIFERSINGNLECIEKHINDFAKLGLRTLVVARRRLSREEFLQYDTDLAAARNALSDRDTKLTAVYSNIETSLSLVGATAVEDRLQNGVPDTLDALRQAGIQVWVLTGDRVETAVNVSYSAGHFALGSTPVSITRQSTMYECGDALRQLDQMLCSEYEYNDTSHHNLVIDGISLTFALSPQHRDVLRSVCQKCAAVLCCRMSPLQKAEVVRLIKESKDKPTTAAIGDGANDVSMILEAHVGLALYGKEGRQAVRASDYAFSQFSYLRHAFLVHGYFFYVRLATLVQYFFYKNIAIVLSQIYFTIYCAFSAQSLYDGYFLTLYNSFFTSIPILVYGLMEQNVPPRLLLANPQIYRTIRRNCRLSVWSFICWSSLGVWHSIVLFFGAYLAMHRDNSLFPNGQGIGVHDYGAIIMTACVIVVNIKLMLHTYHFNWLLIASFVLSFGSYFVISMFYNAIQWHTAQNNLHGSLTTIFTSSSVWLIILLLVAACLLPDYIIRVLTDMTSSVHKLLHHKIRRKKTRVPCARDYITAVAYSRLNGSVTLSQTNLIEDSAASSSTY